MGDLEATRLVEGIDLAQLSADFFDDPFPAYRHCGARARFRGFLSIPARLA
ncbi:MAG: hypothetical protein OEU92_26990 [Alphaproteobacteria bacterium]|nr:hypothetical protein [Alphaproteobacteria bacterium]